MNQIYQNPMQKLFEHYSQREDARDNQNPPKGWKFDFEVIDLKNVSLILSDLFSCSDAL